MTYDEEPKATVPNHDGRLQNDPKTCEDRDTRMTQPRSRRVHPGFVYFIHGGDRIKIGYSKEPEDRLTALQVSTADRLQIIGSIVGDQRKEKSLHDQFRHLHIRGEWFRPETDLVEFICRITGRPMPEFQPDPEDRPLSPEARAMISCVLSHRNQTGAETPKGTILSNLAELATWLDDPDPRPWATHPMQTVKGLMELQSKLLAAT